MHRIPVSYSGFTRSRACVSANAYAISFGRHVGREVAAAAERERPKLGGEEAMSPSSSSTGRFNSVTSRPAEARDATQPFFTVIRR